MRLSADETARWFDANPVVRRETRCMIDGRVNTIMDNDPKASPLIFSVDGELLGSVYAPSYLHE